MLSAARLASKHIEINIIIEPKNRKDNILYIKVELTFSPFRSVHLKAGWWEYNTIYKNTSSFSQKKDRNATY